MAHTSPLKKKMRADHLLLHERISSIYLILSLLEPLLPPPVGTSNVPSLKGEGEEEVVPLCLQQGVAASRQVGQACDLTVVETDKDVLVW